MECNAGNVYAHKLDDAFIGRPTALSHNSEKPWAFDVINCLVLYPTDDGWRPYINNKMSRLLQNRKITSIVEIDARFLHIHTYSGLIRLDKRTGGASLYFPNFSFSFSSKDFQGNYWFSTLQDGLIQVSRFDLLTWSKQSGAIEHEQFSHIAKTKNHLYFASAFGELLEIDVKSLKHQVHKHEPKSDFGMLFYDAIQDRILFNKLGQIHEFKNKKINALGGNRPVKSLWFKSGVGYLLATSQGLFQAEKPEEGPAQQKRLLDGWFREIVPGFDERSVFVASNKGLYHIDIKETGYHLKQHDCEEKQILSLAIDAHGQRLFALAFDGTIYLLERHKTIREFFKLENTTRAVQIAYNDGYLYVATNVGLMQLNCDDLSIKQMNVSNGLSSSNIRQILISDSYCWAATGKGVNRIPLNAFNTTQELGKVILRAIKVNGELIDYKDQLEVNYNEELTLFLDGLSYNSRNDFQLAYLLEGQTQKWITVPGISGRIDIPRLPSGKLKLKIKLIDHLGRDSENTIALKILVLPPFYERWWFYVLVVIVSLGLGYQLFLKRIRMLRKKQAQQLQQLKLEHELRLTQQNALKAQMNPHFLFNVLNSIKGYIYDNDKKNAARYLSDFSNLVRKILDMSTQTTVNLQQELEALQNYIDLEAMLLQSDFKSEMHVDEHIDPTAIHIPALLIQPYVENSFKHGLRHKTGNKILTIHVSYFEDEQILQIQIKDNGIGRHASEKINIETQKEHDSFATGAMEKRISLLNYEKDGLVGVEIIDNFDEDGAPVGTTVNIRLHV
jgi:hypothetical protein